MWYDAKALERAEEGSANLLDAILKARGIEPPPREPKRIRDYIVVNTVRNPLTPIKNIQRTVASYYEISPDSMTSARCSRSIARPRQVAMYLASVLTQKSLSEIGRRFGGRDHTTVIYAIRMVKERVQDDPETAAAVETLMEALAG